MSSGVLKNITWIYWKHFLLVSRLTRSANKRIFCLTRMFSHPEIELRQVEFFQTCNIYNSLFASSWTQSDKSTAANASIFHIKKSTRTHQRHNFRQAQTDTGFTHRNHCIVFVQKLNCVSALNNHENFKLIWINKWKLKLSSGVPITKRWP